MKINESKYIAQKQITHIPSYSLPPSLYTHTHKLGIANQWGEEDLSISVHTGKQKALQVFQAERDLMQGIDYKRIENPEGQRRGHFAQR